MPRFSLPGVRLTVDALFVVLSLTVVNDARAESYQCTFQTGAVAETRFPCTPEMVDRFGKRLVAICPEVRQIDTSPDYIMGLYTYAMAGCSGHFAKMTPEEIGESGEPFFPTEMLTQ